MTRPGNSNWGKRFLSERGSKAIAGARVETPVFDSPGFFETSSVGPTGPVRDRLDDGGEIEEWSLSTPIGTYTNVNDILNSKCTTTASDSVYVNAARIN